MTEFQHARGVPFGRPPKLRPDLTGRRDDAGVDLTNVRSLAGNAGVAFMGDTKGGPFDIAGNLGA